MIIRYLVSVIYLLIIIESVRISPLVLTNYNLKESNTTLKLKTIICFSSKALYKGDEKHINVGSLGDNKPFNRFKNILPCKFTVTAKRTYVIVAILLDDDNRVLLKKLDHELCHGDYINASYIDVRIQQLNHYVY